MELTRREREVGVLIARGMSSSEIAREWCKSVKNVEAHTAGLYRKLKLVVKFPGSGINRVRVALFLNGEGRCLLGEEGSSDLKF